MLSSYHPSLSSWYEINNSHTYILTILSLIRYILLFFDLRFFLPQSWYDILIPRRIYKFDTIFRYKILLVDTSTRYDETNNTWMSVFLSIKVYQILSTLIYKSIIQIFKGINTSTLSSYHLYTRSCILSRDVHYITHSSIDILETNNTIFEIFLSSNQIPSLDPIIDLKLMKYLF